ncbi:NADP-dependent oxidoreductase domain-containing protein [Massariosphaeria phaeospora]|uniref:NADP-dependent oxidoreductase domain-containing protein n=1 Tax=Massariosphaeria phaeospora TaxID=100035 RepID=A0A7C8MJR5_9PLEO|nr:NADP-dependent oxidoreductase domain-containing protein [Massariosphaeria phaeospora]
MSASGRIPHHRLGKNGPTVPALGLGLMSLCGAYGPKPSDEERFKFLDRAVELGATFWDAADIYGDVEELLGKWFARTGKRSEIFLATKFGVIMKDKTFKGMDSTAENCKKSCEASLKKLGTDYIDLYFAHMLNPATPVEETMRALAELQAEGKIKHIALSSVSSNTLRRACKIARVAAVQLEYSPFVLDIEGPAGKDLLATCRELGIAVIPFSPLGHGILTGTFTTAESLSSPGDIRSRMFPRFMEGNLEGNAKIVEKFKAIADKKGCSTSQLSLAWLLKQGEDIIPIPGTKTIKWLEENWRALDVKLTDQEEREVREFVGSVEMLGHKPEAAKRFGYVDTKEES